MQIGTPVRNNVTPMEAALGCYARSLAASGRPPLVIGVGEIKDFTGRYSINEGNVITQGGSLMLFSALGKLGGTVRIAERYDSTIADRELGYMERRQLGDGAAQEFLGGIGGDGVSGGWGFAVQAAELLALDENAGFDDRLGVAGGGEGGDFFLSERGLQGSTGFVVAEVADDGRLGAEGSEVERDVGGTAGGGGFTLDVYDGDGSLGRNAGGVAPEIAVEHHIADDEDAASGEAVEEVLQASVRRGPRRHDE